MGKAELDVLRNVPVSAAWLTGRCVSVRGSDTFATSISSPENEKLNADIFTTVVMLKADFLEILRCQILAQIVVRASSSDLTLSCH